MRPWEKWGDAIKFCLSMFCLLPPRKCALHFFRSHSCYFCHLGLFPHVLQRLCVQDFCKKQALIHSIFPAVPFVSQRITRCPILRKKCGGRVHKRLFFRLFLRNLEKGCCFRICQSVHEILPKSLLETVFEKRGTLNWIEPLLWRRSCENPLMDWRSSWRKGDWFQAWTWFRNFRLYDWSCWCCPWKPVKPLWCPLTTWDSDLLGPREARMPSVFGRQC